jgi:hypothetical protein
MGRKKGNARDDDNQSHNYENMQEEDRWNPWDRLCVCGHPMHRHILDWDLDPEVDCRQPGCRCPEFELRKTPGE